MLTILFALLVQPAAHAAAYTAEYEVPAPAELRAYARFEMPYRDDTRADGITVFRYTLPATLLGAERTFELRGRVGAGKPSFELTGSDASMRCEAGAETVECRVTHHGVGIDLAGVRAALDASALSPAEKDGRFALASFAAREGGDLVGVIRYSRDELTAYGLR